MTSETRVQIAELEAKIAKLEKQEIETGKNAASEIDSSFAHGQEEIEVALVHKGYSSGHRWFEELGDLKYTWDEIVEVLGPFMIDEAPEPSLRRTFNSHMLSEIQADPEGWTNAMFNDSAEISDKSWGSIIVQLRALHLITTGTKKRTVSDKAVYWKLTQAGDDYLVALRAVPSSDRAHD